MTEADLALVLAWRNHPDVRRFMFTRDEIAPDDHRRWFERQSRGPGRHLLVYEIDAVPTGFVAFTADASGVFDWGFYVAPGSARGTGRGLGATALDHAFGSLGAHKVYGEVLSDNLRSIRFHEGLGFRREGLLREHHFDGARYHDVACFGLLRDEWQAPA